MNKNQLDDHEDEYEHDELTEEIEQTKDNQEALIFWMVLFTLLAMGGVCILFMIGFDLILLMAKFKPIFTNLQNYFKLMERDEF